MKQPSRGNRTGSVFPIRVSDAQRAEIERRIATGHGPKGIGPHLLWSSGITAAAIDGVGAEVLPGRGAGAGITAPAQTSGYYPLEARVVLDLCGGTGAWSRPYADAGYDVRVVTLPEHDVRSFRPTCAVWGVLAAPPCTEFSIAKTTGARDLLAGLETVVACLHVIALARPRWWALENPGSGLLRRWLGRPRDVWQPCDFGDAHTKLTAIWGDFAIPARAPVRAESRMVGRNATERAITPAGFARAFFEANP